MADPGSAGARPTQRLSLRARLNVLVALCVLPLLAVTLTTDYLDYRAACRAAAEHALASARGFAEDISRLLQSEIASLQTLALSPHLQRDDLDGFAGQAHAFLGMQPPGAVLGLAGADGRPLVAYGEDVPHDRTLPARSVPDSVHRVFAAAVPEVSGYFIDALTRRGGFSIGVPVRHDGKVVWDLFLNPGVATLLETAQRQHPPAGWRLGVIDSRGVLFTRWPGPADFVGHEVVPGLLAQMQVQREGTLQVVSLEGVPVLGVYATVPGVDWRVVIAIPFADLNRPLLTAALLALAAGGALLVGGLLLAAAVARSIVGPIARLQAMAQRSDQMDAAALQLRPTGLPETDAVAAALHAAAVARADALARLRSFAGQLEQRVAEEVAVRQEAQARAAHGARMQALGRLVSGVAHDFANVLQTVEAAANLLDHRAENPESVRRLAKILRNAGRQGGAVTGRLLGLARPPQAPAAFAVAPLFEELRELLAASLTGGAGAGLVDLDMTAPAGLPEVWADRAQLETVLLNLAGNARDAMPQGGRLGVSAAAEWVALGVAGPRGLAPGGYVCLSLADTGTGMPPEVLARATEPFFTTKAAGKGTGLGLALARGFAEQSGGALAVESAPGQGTLVRLWLPQAAPGDPDG